jgi:hypothetical protein
MFNINKLRVQRLFTITVQTDRPKYLVKFLFMKLQVFTVTVQNYRRRPQYTYRLVCEQCVYVTLVHYD